MIARHAQLSKGNACRGIPLRGALNINVDYARSPFRLAFVTSAFCTEGKYPDALISARLDEYPGELLAALNEDASRPQETAWQLTRIALERRAAGVDSNGWGVAQADRTRPMARPALDIN
jgi:hypothetical protein